MLKEIVWNNWQIPHRPYQPHHAEKGGCISPLQPSSFWRLQRTSRLQITSPVSLIFFTNEDPSWRSSYTWLFNHLLSWINIRGHCTEIRISPLPTLPSSSVCFSNSSFGPGVKQAVTPEPQNTTSKTGASLCPPPRSVVFLSTQIPDFELSCLYTTSSYEKQFPPFDNNQELSLKKAEPPWTHSVNSMWAWIECLWVLQD